MTKDTLIKELKKHKQREQISDAVFGDEFKRWRMYRIKDSSSRLIDPNSGQWVPEFVANKKTYFIRDPEQGIGLLRYAKLKQMLSIIGFDATYPDQLAALNRMNDAANTLVTEKPRLDILFTEIQNMRAAISKTDREWDYSVYAATLFIVTADEDLSTWTEELAEKKIADWNKAGYHEHDFFLLVMFWGSRLAERSNKSFQVLKERAKRRSMGI